MRFLACTNLDFQSGAEIVVLPLVGQHAIGCSSDAVVVCRKGLGFRELQGSTAKRFTRKPQTPTHLSSCFLFCACAATQSSKAVLPERKSVAL